MLKIPRKKTIEEKPEKKLAIVLPLNTKHRGLDYIIELVKNIRPAKHRNIAEAEQRFQSVLYQLQQDKSALFTLRKALLSQFADSNLIMALTESGITRSRGFVQELVKKLKHKFLPSLQQPNDFLYVINHVFYLKSDHHWVERIDKDLWKNFFELLGIQINLTNPVILRQLNQAMQILSYRVTTLGLEREITDYFNDQKDAIHPFLEQNKLVNMYMERQFSMRMDEKRLLLYNVQENLYNCRQSIRAIQEHRDNYGTSLAQTFLTVRLQQQVERMLIIIDVLDNDDHFNIDRFIEYFYTVIKNENTRNSLGEFLSQNFGMLAYQIAEHKGKKGESYISSTQGDFMRLFRSSMGGGLIVSFVAIFKNLLSQLPLPIFWQGMTYGTNYAAGFVLMDKTGTTLATKQPAYTASAVAGSLDSRKQNGRPDLKNLALMVAKVSRSQIASFAGNLLIVFPLTYLLALFFDAATGHKIAEGAAADRLLAEQHPFRSLALLYACFTGFFLFLSGLIAGYIENHVVYGKITERLKSHPIFSNTMKPRQLNRLIRIMDTNAGALAGSISLGFFLGCAGPLGKLLGIPFDIRHITISAGNTAIGFYGRNHNVPLSYLLTVIAGVLLIGFLNFLVSFSLAFYVAVKSRGIRLKDYKKFLGILYRYFRQHPKDFIWPPAAMRNATEI